MLTGCRKTTAAKFQPKEERRSGSGGVEIRTSPSRHWPKQRHGSECHQVRRNGPLYRMDNEERGDRHHQAPKHYKQSRKMDHEINESRALPPRMGKGSVFQRRNGLSSIGRKGRSPEWETLKGVMLTKRKIEFWRREKAQSKPRFVAHGVSSGFSGFSSCSLLAVRFRDAAPSA